MSGNNYDTHDKQELMLFRLLENMESDLKHIRLDYLSFVIHVAIA